MIKINWLRIMTLAVIGLLFLFIFFKWSHGVFHAAPSLMEKSFTEIYDHQRWGVGSGPGSEPKQAQPYLALLQQYLSDPKIHAVVDLGCGDWQLMQTMQLPDSKVYEGYDVVKSIIATNHKRYHKANVHFYFMNGLDAFKPKYHDLLIVKDVLQHWPNQDIQYFLTHILPQFSYALMTNDYEVGAANKDIHVGDYRPIDLEAAPFYFKHHLSVQLDYDYSAHNTTKRVYLYVNPNIQKHALMSTDPRSMFNFSHPRKY